MQAWACKHTHKHCQAIFDHNKVLQAPHFDRPAAKAPDDNNFKSPIIISETELKTKLMDTNRDDFSDEPAAALIIDL